MSAYLGDVGHVEIVRSGDGFSSVLAQADVDASQDRFSLEWGVAIPIITGDRLLIRRTDGKDLQLVDGHDEHDVELYAHVDDIGGIRLYETFGNALTGGPAGAVSLVEPTDLTQPVFVDVVNWNKRCVAQIRSWDLTTERQSVDISTLGDEYRKQYDKGLISGAGNLTCIWDFKADRCDPMNSNMDAEQPHYFAELVIRCKEGAKFTGYFTLYDDGSGPNSLWYEMDCIVTNVAMNFSTEEVVGCTIAFVTTGPVHLRSGRLPSYLLQEAGDNLILEEEPGLLLVESY